MSVLKTKFGPGWLPYTLLGAANGVASLGSDGKLSAAQLPSGISGGLQFKGAFDASASTFPASPSNGDLYIVSVGGSVGGSLSPALAIGDYVFYSSAGTIWEPIYAPKTTDQLAEGSTNLFFTAARAQSAAVQNSLAASTVIAPSASAVNSALALKAASFTRAKERYVLSGTDVTNGYLVLAHLALGNSLTVGVQGLGLIEQSLDSGATGDYVVTVDGTSGNSKLTFANDLASAGSAPLASSDVVFVQYEW